MDSYSFGGILAGPAALLPACIDYLAGKVAALVHRPRTYRNGLACYPGEECRSDERAGFGNEFLTTAAFSSDFTALRRHHIFHSDQIQLTDLCRRSIEPFIPSKTSPCFHLFRLPKTCISNLTNMILIAFYIYAFISLERTRKTFHGPRSACL